MNVRHPWAGDAVQAIGEYGQWVERDDSVWVLRIPAWSGSAVRRYRRGSPRTRRHSLQGT
jgi:hypothetical protein